jgi:DNA-binding NarL/FixJ family response regulator
VIDLLVVDDNVPIRALLAAAMELDGRFRVVGEAGTGFEAIEQAQRLQPHAVLLDLAMPELDGLSALPQLRELLPNAAIVCLSGMSTHHFEAAALGGGADRYLEKGGSLVVLADELASAFTSRG